MLITTPIMYEFRSFIPGKYNRTAVLADCKIREGVCCVVTSSVLLFHSWPILIQTPDEYPVGRFDVVLPSFMLHCKMWRLLSYIINHHLCFWREMGDEYGQYCLVYSRSFINNNDIRLELFANKPTGVVARTS